MNRVVFMGLALLAGSFLGGAARAQAVLIPTQQAMSGVELTLSMSERGSGRSLARATTRSADDGPLSLQAGTAVVICFTANRSGWVTLWSVDDLDRPVRIYPNRLSHENGETISAAQVAEGERYCLGEDASYSFVVGGQTGATYQLSLNWTPTETDALPASAYVQIGPRSRTDAEHQARFAATHLSYSPRD